MAEGLLMTKSAAPATPAANKVNTFVDTADRRVKAIDETGLISTLNNDGMKNVNRIINGGMRVQQRCATASTAIAGVTTSTRAGQVADRWAVTTSVASNLNWAQIDTAGAQEAGLQARYYGSIISATAGKKVMLSQFILGSDMAHLRGQKVRVSLKHNQKVGAGQTYRLGLIQLNVSGTVDVCPAFLSGAWSTTTGVDPAWGTNLAAIAPDASPTGENGTINGSYLDITTVATTWTRSSCVFTVPTNAKNLCVVFFSNATGGTTDNISVSEVQLTQGPDIVDFTDGLLADDVYACQRFYCKSFPLTTVPAASLTEAAAGCVQGILGKAGSGTVLGSIIPVQFPVQMWKVPTITLFTPIGAGAVVYRVTGTTPAVQGATATRALTDRGLTVTATNEATTNGVIGDMVGIHYVAEAEFIT